MPSVLFTPISLGPFSLMNRLVVPPMCQYSADDGCASVWHLQQLMNYAMMGGGLVMVEATAVERRGRISHGDLGLYNDANEDALGEVMIAARRVAIPGTRFGIQLAHAGRKAAVQRPWEGGKPLTAAEDAWPTVAASAIPFAKGYSTPAALDDAVMERVRNAFVAAAKRSVRLGFDVIEVHCTHGYLLDSFLSPITNARTDDYGGSIANRMRFPLSVAQAVKDVLPSTAVLGARITGTNWTENGWSMDDAGVFANELKKIGAGYVCVSSGGIMPGVAIPSGPSYQVPLAAHVKKASAMPTRTAGHIVTPEQAEEIITSGWADMIALARALLDNPHWIWHAANRFGVEFNYPPQYARVAPSLWKAAALARPDDFPDLN
jgi:2,4-dienoyl-CoA reductase-like NADH-dependent reductase (Old Yellow Enzyme family)